MAKERSESGRVRLFVALDIPDQLRAGIEAWGRLELGDPALRRTPAGSLHVTLAFLGHRPEADVGRIGELVESLPSAAPRISLRDPEPRPSRGRPRLYALPVESSGAVSLQAELVEKLAAGGLHEAEKRRFWPHLTVARVRAEGRGSRQPHRVSSPPGSLPQELLQPVGAVRVALYRSELQPMGAQYARLAHIDLR